MMKKDSLFNESGFTLVEIIIAASILVVVLGIAFNFLLTAFSLEKSTTKNVDLQQSIRFAMDSIIRDLRNTPEVTSFAQNRIIFKEGSDSNLNPNTIEYYVAGTQLIRNEINNGKGSYSPVANNINQVTFTKDSTDLNKKDYFITIVLTAKLDPQEMTMRSNVFLKRAWMGKNP